jgi:uncharacterized protein DUF6879
MAKVPPFGELIAATTSSAVHLEMRDAYTPDDQRFLDWQAGKLLPERPTRNGRPSCALTPRGESGSAAPVSSRNRSRPSSSSSTR